MHADIGAIASALEKAGLLVERRGAADVVLTDLTDDSRAVHDGAMFIAVKGTERDGHDYLDAAAQAGASAAIVEDRSRTELPALVVNDGRRAAAIAAAAFFGWPARDLQLVGVTGTNGKTTTVNMLRHVLDSESARSASIGTLGVAIGSEAEELPGGGGLTTPGPVELQRVFRSMPACVASLWKCRRTRSTSGASKAFRSTSECSPISRAIISIITGRWTSTSPRSPG
jgi:UDP-N-acetylmuramoyl-L-alanyl-D-glutamate--2,6-diaminopimelate ligase